MGRLGIFVVVSVLVTLAVLALILGFWVFGQLVTWQLAALPAAALRFAAAIGLVVGVIVAIAYRKDSPDV